MTSVLFERNLCIILIKEVESEIGEEAGLYTKEVGFGDLKARK